MKDDLKMAWRNIWRNRRRSFITVASIFFALFFALIMRSIQIGTYGHMVNTVIHSYTGYLQIQHKDFWDDKTIDNSIDWNDSLQNIITQIPEITNTIPRVESFALASYELQTKGVIVMGIHPEKENQLTKLKDKIVEGQYLTSGEQAVLVSQRLAKFLKIKINDTLVLIGQGFHGNSASGIFPVKGIVKYPSPDLDNQLVLLPIETAQHFFSMPNRITSLVVNATDEKKVKPIAKQLKYMLSNNNYRIMTWDEMLVQIVEMIKSDSAGGFIFLGILYMIVAFGVFGTVIMMTGERRKEFGVLISIGIQKSKLATIIWLEIIMLALVAIVISIICSMPIIFYFHSNPIHLLNEYASVYEQYGFEPVMPFAWQSNFFIAQSLIILSIVTITTLHPIITILRLEEHKALKA